MANNMRNRARRRARKFVTFVTVTAVIAFVVILAVILVKSIQLIRTEEAESESAKTIVVTEGLTEGMFLSQRDDSIPESGKVSYSTEAEAILQKWKKMARGVVCYHMTITETETYGANDSLIKAVPSNPSFIMEQVELDVSQTRTIDVYSTIDDASNQWYVICVQESNFIHSSQFSIMPGVYFFRADGTSAIHTLKGEITGEEKEKLMNQLTQYTLIQYCNPERIAGRTGDLEAVSSVNGEYVAVLFSNETGQYEISGTANQIQKANAIYSVADRGEVYQISVEIEYGTMFDPEQVQVLNKNPYEYTGIKEELELWDGSSSQTITLAQQNEVNEVWKQIAAAEEYSARGVIEATTTVMLDEPRELEEHAIITVKRKMVEGMLLTEVVVNYPQRSGFTTTSLVAGNYLFNDEFIWTDRGILAIKDAPNLYWELINLGADTWSNAKWQLGNCGPLYLEEIELDDKTEIALTEQGDDINGYPNYARIRLDRQHHLEVMQTHIRFEDDGRRSSIDLETRMEYDLEEITISIPSELKK